MLNEYSHEDSVQTTYWLADELRSDNAAEVYAGLADRFGDDAPRVVHAGTVDDAIVIPSQGPRGIRKRMGWAGMRRLSLVE